MIDFCPSLWDLSNWTICYKSTVGSKPEPDAPEPEKSSGNSTPFSFESERKWKYLTFVRDQRFEKSAKSPLCRKLRASYKGLEKLTNSCNRDCRRRCGQLKTDRRCHICEINFWIFIKSNQASTFNEGSKNSELLESNATQNRDLNEVAWLLLLTN